MQKVTRLPLALTSGDPAGIGLELAIKVWIDRRQTECPPFALFADARELAARARLLDVEAPVVRIPVLSDAVTVFDRAIPVVHIAQSEDATAGRPTSRNAGAVVTSIERATASVIAGDAAALVTNPIAKSVLYEAGFDHPGHTEFLAELAGRALPDEPHTPVMMLACDELRVVPLTIHVPLAKVPSLITRELIEETVRITHDGLMRDFGLPNPRIVVAGLNPHAGEGGAIGGEDRAVIAPAVAQLQAEGLQVTGPHSADTLFHAQARSRYDAVVAMYHDQALIPIKTLAFDIAGKGIARPYSLIEALKLAREAALRRARSTA